MSGEEYGHRCSMETINIKRKIKTKSRVLVFVPSSSVKKEFLQLGLAELQKLGFIADPVKQILSKHGFVAKEPMQAYLDFQNGFL